MDLATFDDGIEIDMRYAGSENFVGAPVDGYAAPRCLLTLPAARALVQAQRDLAPRRLGLHVYDCFRPQRAVDHFVRWAEDLADQRTKARYYPHVDKARLFEAGYIAARSSHSRGSTVDVTLVRRGGPDDGTLLDMGTPWDLFDPRSHTDPAGEDPLDDTQLRNRRVLRAAMHHAGFENLPEEWWHYTLRDEPNPDEYWDLEIR